MVFHLLMLKPRQEYRNIDKWRFKKPIYDSYKHSWNWLIYRVENLISTKHMTKNIVSGVMKFTLLMPIIWNHQANECIPNFDKTHHISRYFDTHNHFSLNIQIVYLKLTTIYICGVMHGVCSVCSTTYAHRFTILFYGYIVSSRRWIRAVHLPIFFRVVSLVPEQSKTALVPLKYSRVPL